MKSLEIVKGHIKALEIFNDNKILIEKEYLEQIKQDLEVLEIIMKKDVLTGVLKCCLKEPANDKEALDIYNLPFPDYRELTLEELQKLKQWLEVNE